jgi:hypothetical protein
MSILYDSKIPHRPKTLEVTINSSRGIDNGLVDVSVALENTPLVTEENVGPKGDCPWRADAAA